MYDKHKINEHIFDYKNFIDYLRKFEFNPEEIYVKKKLIKLINLKYNN